LIDVSTKMHDIDDNRRTDYFTGGVSALKMRQVFFPLSHLVYFLQEALRWHGSAHPLDADMRPHGDVTGRKISPSIPVSLDRNEAATYDPGDPIAIRATVSCPVRI
jgi:hypothetical protein